MSRRTDPHRPGAIIPANYEPIIAYNCATAQDGWPIPSYGINCELDRASGPSVGRHGTPPGRCCVVSAQDCARAEEHELFGSPGKCGSCGAWFVFGELWRHVQTGALVHLGHDCAEKYGLMMDRSAAELALGRARQAAAVAIQRERNRERRAAFLAGHPGMEAALKVEHRITRDIAERFERYCELSDAQITLVLKLADEASRPPQEQDRLVPAPCGRQTFMGKIVSVKGQDTAFGIVTRMTVKVTTPDGGLWLAWGTAPESMLSDAGQHGGLKGCEVEVKATLQPGQESHFAIAKRPSGKILTYSAEHAPEDCFSCLHKDTKKETVA